MLPENQKKAYKAFYDSARHNEYFDEKNKLKNKSSNET